MKHLLMDPAFPDLIPTAAAEEHERKPHNDFVEAPIDLTDEFLTFLGQAEIASTRLW